MTRGHQHSFRPIIRYHNGWQLITGYRDCDCGKSYGDHIRDPQENAKVAARIAGRAGQADHQRH